MIKYETANLKREYVSYLIMLLGLLSFGYKIIDEPYFFEFQKFMHIVTNLTAGVI